MQSNKKLDVLIAIMDLIALAFSVAGIVFRVKAHKRYIEIVGRKGYRGEIHTYFEYPKI